MLFEASETESCKRPSNPKPVNLTPHDICVLLEDGSKIVYPRSGKVLRAIPEKQKYLGKLDDGVPLVTAPTFVGVDLGDLDSNAPIIVSAIVAELLNDRMYEGVVLSPDTGPDSVVRDNEGKIVAVRRLNQHGRLNSKVLF